MFKYAKLFKFARLVERYMTDKSFKNLFTV